MNYILGDLIERNISVQVLVSLLIVLVAIAVLNRANHRYWIFNR